MKEFIELHDFQYKAKGFKTPNMFWVGSELGYETFSSSHSLKIRYYLR